MSEPRWEFEASLTLRGCTVDVVRLGARKKFRAVVDVPGEGVGAGEWHGSTLSALTSLRGAILEARIAAKSRAKMEALDTALVVAMALSSVVRAVEKGYAEAKPEPKPGGGKK